MIFAQLWRLTFWAFTKRHTTCIFASFVNAVLGEVGCLLFCSNDTPVTV
jgi:hypothetical protein